MRLRYRWIYRRAWEDYLKGFNDQHGPWTRPPDPVWREPRFRIAYDAGYDRHAHAGVPRELPVEVWALVLAEHLRP